MQLQGARPHNNGSLAVHDDPRARPLVQPQKFADTRDEIGVMHHMPCLWNMLLIIPAEHRFWIALDCAKQPIKIFIVSATMLLRTADL